MDFQTNDDIVSIDFNDPFSDYEECNLYFYFIFNKLADHEERIISSICGFCFRLDTHFIYYEYTLYVVQELKIMIFTGLT